MADPDDSFVSRWSRRKQAVRPETAEPDTALVVPEAPEGGEPVPRETADSEELVASLPDIETLTEESDFTAFLQDGVPEALRRKALRRLWRVNPVFANLDGLNDYDEDFTLATSALQGAIKTIYQVGKGMVDPDEPEPTPETADDAAPIEEVQTAETPSQDGALEVPEESPVEPLAEDSEATDIPVQVVLEPPAAPAAGGAAAPLSPATSSSAAARRWGHFKS